jgi:hypothetical protein
MIIVTEGNPCPTCQATTHQFPFRGRLYRACSVCLRVSFEPAPRMNGAVLYDSSQQEGIP